MGAAWGHTLRENTHDGGNGDGGYGDGDDDGENGGYGDSAYGDGGYCDRHSLYAIAMRPHQQC